MINFQTHQKGIDLKILLDDTITNLVIADEIRIKQVLTNLLGNAVKFTATGYIELSMKLLSRSTEKIKIRFNVKDTGIGINPGNTKKIFEAFVQEDISTTKKFGGTGLGLTISNKLLALMDSKLQLESKVGEGSEFYFDLDLALA
jgi:signal transduction histidine kinase